MLVVRTKTNSVALVSSVAQDELMTKNQNTLFEILQSNDWRSAVPNVFLRSSMFGIGDRVAPDEDYKIEIIKDKKIFSTGQYDILYSGEHLNQYDLSVWIAIMKLAQKKGFDFDNILRFSARNLAVEMGVKYSGTVGKANKISLSGLMSCKLTVKHSSTDEINKKVKRVRTYSTGIITSIASDEGASTHTYVVKFNKTIIDLFKWNDFTQLDIRIRHELKSKLAKWVHAFYSTHAKPISYDFEYLYKISGSKNSDINGFIKSLKHVSNQIQEVGLKYGYHFEGTFVGGRYFVEHSGSPSQMRHNIKRCQSSDTTDEIELYKAKLEIESTPLSADQLLKKQKKLASLKQIRILNSRKNSTEKAIAIERKKVANLS